MFFQESTSGRFLKQKALVIGYSKLIQQFLVFFQKGALPVMYFLMDDVLHHILNLGMAVRKCTESVLPGKSSGAKPFLIYPFGGMLFYLLHELREAFIGLHAKE